MLDIVFWIMFLLTPIVIFSLLKVAGEQLNQISLVNVTTFSLYVFSVIGLFPLFYQLDAYRVAIGIVDQGLVLKTLFFSFINIVFFLIGVLFVRKIIKLKPIPIRSFEIVSLKKIQILSAFLFLFLIGVFLYFYIGKINQVALFVALKEGAADAKIARSAMGNDFSGKYHWYSLVLHNIGTLITLTFYVSWLLKKKFTLFFLFLVAFSMSAFISLMSIEKAPFVGLMVALFMAYYLTRHNGYIPKKDMVFLGVSVLLILVVFYIYFMGVSSPMDALFSVFSRAFAGSISPAYFYLEYFPEYRDFLMGRTFPNPGGIMPYTPVRYTVELMNWKFPNLAALGIVGSMPTVFWAESYVNFGVVGIPIIAFIMGLIVALISYLISKLELNPLTIAFVIWVIFHFRNLAITGFSGFLYDFYMLGVTIVLFFILASRRKIIIRKKTRFK